MFVTVALIALSSCGNSNSPRPSSFYDKPEEEIEEIPDAEVKPYIFYQHLLERFCQQYYGDCFSGRDYHYNSVVVDGLDVVGPNYKDNHIESYNVKVVGRHSFEGFLKNHNDSPFEAFVDELGDNSYKVSFYIHRYGPFGDQLEERESATRTMTYSE